MSTTAINLKQEIMKNNLLYAIIIMVSISLMSSTCSSDDDGNNSNNNSQEIAQIESQVELGTWIVLSFIDSGQDETNDFNGYGFTFASDGTLTATNGTTTYTGTWSITDSNSNDDSSDDIDFNIFFPVPDNNDFEDLNDDWDVVSHSATTISLIDISGGNGGTDTLVFTKL
tara:strand:+ start:1186 stop:1698 length:513 start_codon:yes stop_codon:yes gene_type:complete